MGERRETFLKGVIFPWKRRGGITCFRPFSMVAQTSTPNIIRSDFLLFFLLLDHIARCLFSHPAEDSSASSKKQNLRFNSKMRRRSCSLYLLNVDRLLEYSDQ